jgi:hypothetical protein
MRSRQCPGYRVGMEFPQTHGPLGRQDARAFVCAGAIRMTNGFGNASQVSLSGDVIASGFSAQSIA